MALSENQQKAIDWIEEQLAKPDFTFTIKTGVYLSVHHFLNVQRERILHSAGKEQAAAYYRTKKIKDEL